MTSFCSKLNVLRSAGLGNRNAGKVATSQQVHHCRQLSFTVVATTFNGGKVLHCRLRTCAVRARLLNQPISLVLGDPKRKHGNVSGSCNRNKRVGIGNFS
jgi:hypothetical protein